MASKKQTEKKGKQQQQRAADMDADIRKIIDDAVEKGRRELSARDAGKAEKALGRERDTLARLNEAARLNSIPGLTPADKLSPETRAKHARRPVETGCASVGVDFGGEGEPYKDVCACGGGCDGSGKHRVDPDKPNDGGDHFDRRQPVKGRDIAADMDAGQAEVMLTVNGVRHPDLQSALEAMRKLIAEACAKSNADAHILKNMDARKQTDADRAVFDSIRERVRNAPASLGLTRDEIDAATRHARRLEEGMAGTGWPTGDESCAGCGFLDVCDVACGGCPPEECMRTWADELEEDDGFFGVCEKEDGRPSYARFLGWLGDDVDDMSPAELLACYDGWLAGHED